MNGLRSLSYTFAIAISVLFARTAAAQPSGTETPNGEAPAAAQAPANGQAAADAEAVAPQIRGVLADSQRVYDRLKLALDLTTPQDQKQFATLEGYIDVFLFGVDRKRPVRMDVLTGRDETSYRLYVPIDNFRTFWKQNLAPLGIPVKAFQGVKGQYRLGGGRNDAFDGYMLYEADKREGYGIIIEKPPGAKAPKWPNAQEQEPLAPVQGLLGAGYDAALQLTNKPEGVDVRHAHYGRNKNEILGKLKRDTDESAADFDLRKFFAGIQFDESERLYSEAKDFVVGLTVSPKPEQATAKLRLEPLPETSLAKSIAIIGTQPSRFAGVPRGENAGATGRVVFPLDEFRKANALALSKKIRENELAEIDAATGVTPELKEARTQFTGLLADLMNAGIESGVFDGFVEMTKEQGGAHTVVGGVKAPDGTAWLPLIELLPKARPDYAVKTNVGEHKGIALHELTLNKEQNPDFFDLFGGGRLLAGTGPDTVWYAAGPNAEEALKRAIDQSAEPGQPEPNFVSFRGELLPAIRIIDRRLGAKGQKKYRQLAMQAFQNGEGRLSADLTRDGDAVTGEFALDRGILRLVGMALADFSRENLQ